MALTQHTSNLGPFASPPQHRTAPASGGTVDMVVMIAALETQVVSLVADVTCLKKDIDDTIITVGYHDFSSPRHATPSPPGGR